MERSKSMTSRLIDVSLALLIWVLCLVAMGFLGRVMWECLLIGWRLI